MATFFNQATLSYNGNVTNSNITTGELLEVLSATKTSVLDNYSRGSVVTYVINIVNSGTTAYTALTINDNLGEYTFTTSTVVPLSYVDGSVKYYINGVAQASLTVTAGPPLIISGITVPAGGVATIIYAAEVNEYAPLNSGASITNTATISGGGAADITVTDTISSISEANLTISKSVCPVTVTENGQLTYTFVIQNSGNTAADIADNAVVTDTFDPILSGLSVTFNGTSWNAPTNYTYNETTGVFTTVAGQITVPAATYTQDSTTGTWITEPGVSVLTITGTI